MHNIPAPISENRFSLRERFSSDRLSWLLLLISIALALAIRLAFLGTKSLWLDEIWSVEIARMPWHSFLWVVRNMDPNTSLYYGLLHLWMSFGESEFSLRLLSVLFSVLTLPPLFALGTHLLGRRAGAIAALLLAVNLFDVQWSQEARTYALLVFLVTLSSLYFIKSIEGPSRKNWLLYSSFSVFAVYAHIFAVLVLFAQLASLAFLRRRELPWKGVCSSAIAVGIFTSPVAWLIVVRSRAPLVPLDWIPGPSIRHIYD
ncbi:MAG: glycosyltransferase family 39 protein, partial [Acidobacteriaceae bacterium]